MKKGRRKKPGKTNEKKRFEKEISQTVRTIEAQMLRRDIEI